MPGNPTPVCSYTHSLHSYLGRWPRAQGAPPLLQPHPDAPAQPPEATTGRRLAKWAPENALPRDPRKALFDSFLSAWFLKQNGPSLGLQTLASGCAKASSPFAGTWLTLDLRHHPRLPPCGEFFLEGPKYVLLEA